MKETIDGGPPTQILVCPGTECGVSRRAFLGSAMVAAAALLSACGDGRIGAAGNPFAPDTTAGGVTGTVVRLADYPVLANVGGIARVDTPGGPVAVVTVAAGSYAAFSMRCPHQGTVIDIHAGAFLCPNHKARFSASGQWAGGQRTNDLIGVPLSYSAADGTLTLGAVPGAGGGGTGGGDDDGDDDGGDDDGGDA